MLFGIFVVHTVVIPRKTRQRPEDLYTKKRVSSGDVRSEYWKIVFWLLGGYLYFQNAPTDIEFHNECIKSEPVLSIETVWNDKNEKL